MRKHSVILNGHSTSVSLEDPFWSHLKRIACEREITLQAFIEKEDARIRKQDAGGPVNLSSTLRLAVLRDLETKAKATGLAC